MKRLSLMLVSLLAMFGVTFAVQGADSAFACKVDISSGELPADCANDSEQLRDKINAFVSVISFIAISFAVAMIIYGGVKYITAQGDPKASEDAKKTIWHAGLGLFIVLAAFVILKLFLSASGAEGVF